LIQLSDALIALIDKMAQCQDSMTGARVFGIHAVVTLDDQGIPTIGIEDDTFETPSGDIFHGKALRRTVIPSDPC
jgi:hypothetical protein